MSTSAVDPSLPVSIYLWLLRSFFPSSDLALEARPFCVSAAIRRMENAVAFVSSAAGSAGVGEVDSTPRPYGKDLL